MRGFYSLLKKCKRAYKNAEKKEDKVIKNDKNMLDRGELCIKTDVLKCLREIVTILPRLVPTYPLSYITILKVLLDPKS